MWEREEEVALTVVAVQNKDRLVPEVSEVTRLFLCRVTPTLRFKTSCKPGRKTHSRTKEQRRDHLCQSQCRHRRNSESVISRWGCHEACRWGTQALGGWTSEFSILELPPDVSVTLDSLFNHLEPPVFSSIKRE